MLKIHKGGVLKKDRKKIPKEHELAFLMESCRIANGVTLRDVFELINHHMPILKVIIGNWCDEIVAEGLKGSESESDMEYLELYWTQTISVENKKSDMSGTMFPSFHGIKKKEPWSVSLTPVGTIINKPLILRKKAKIAEDNYDKPWDGETLVYEIDSYDTTLLQIYYGIIWELSYHGSPESRDIFRESLLESAEKVNKFIEERKKSQQT